MSQITSEPAATSAAGSPGRVIGWVIMCGDRLVCTRLFTRRKEAVSFASTQPYTDRANLPAQRFLWTHVTALRAIPEELTPEQRARAEAIFAIDNYADMDD